MPRTVAQVQGRDWLKRAQHGLALMQTRVPRAARTFVALLGVALCLATFTPMVAVALGVELPPWEALVQRAAAPFCHQLAERSFVLHGHVFPICARCTGMWLGITLGVALFVLRTPCRTPRLRWLTGTALAVVTLGLSYLDHLRDQGLGPGWPWTRALLGLGIFAGVTLAISSDALALLCALGRSVARALRRGEHVSHQRKTTP
jgi:hypothetical protein